MNSFISFGLNGASHPNFQMEKYRMNLSIMANRHRVYLLFSNASKLGFFLIVFTRSYWKVQRKCNLFHNDYAFSNRQTKKKQIVSKPINRCVNPDEIICIFP